MKTTGPLLVAHVIKSYIYGQCMYYAPCITCLCSNIPPCPNLVCTIVCMWYTTRSRESVHRQWFFVTELSLVPAAILQSTIHEDRLLCFWRVFWRGDTCTFQAKYRLRVTSNMSSDNGNDCAMACLRRGMQQQQKVRGRRMF